MQSDISGLSLCQYLVEEQIFNPIVDKLWEKMQEDDMDEHLCCENNL